MFEIVKLANKINSEDIVATAGILSLLKNKIVQLFNPEEAQKAAKILEATKELKPVLSDVYEYAGKVEKAISDASVEDYNSNILYLKDRVNHLNFLLGKIKDIEIARAISPEKKQYAPVENALKDFYKVGSSLKDLGISTVDINPKNIIYLIQGINEKATQKGIVFSFLDIPKDVYIRNIYDKISEMRITSVRGPGLNLVDSRWGEEGSKKKGSMATIFVESDYLKLDAPVPFLIKVRLELMDKRKEVLDPPQLRLYRQFVVDVLTADKKANTLYSIVKNATENKYYIEDSRKLYSSIINGLSNIDKSKVCDIDSVSKVASTIKDSFVIYKLNSLNDLTDFEVIDPSNFGIKRSDCKLIYNTYKQAFDHIVNELNYVSNKLANNHTDLSKFASLITKVAHDKFQKSK